MDTQCKIGIESTQDLLFRDKALDKHNLPRALTDEAVQITKKAPTYLPSLRPTPYTEQLSLHRAAIIHYEHGSLADPASPKLPLP